MSPVSSSFRIAVMAMLMACAVLAMSVSATVVPATTGSKAALPHTTPRVTCSVTSFDDSNGGCIPCPTNYYFDSVQGQCEPMQCTPVAVPANGQVDTTDSNVCDPAVPIFVGQSCSQQCAFGYAIAPGAPYQGQCVSNSTDAAPSSVGSFVPIACYPCAINSVPSSAGQCDACPAGQYANSGDTACKSTSCTPFAPSSVGTIDPSFGAWLNPIPCSSWISIAIGAQCSQACAQGYGAASTHAQCVSTITPPNRIPYGTFVPVNCTACAANTYSNNVNGYGRGDIGSCQSCGAYATSQPGSSSCTASVLPIARTLSMPVLMSGVGQLSNFIPTQGIAFSQTIPDTVYMLSNMQIVSFNTVTRGPYTLVSQLTKGDAPRAMSVDPAAPQYLYTAMRDAIGIEIVRTDVTTGASIFISLSNASPGETTAQLTGMVVGPNLIGQVIPSVASGLTITTLYTAGTFSSGIDTIVVTYNSATNTAAGVISPFNIAAAAISAATPTSPASYTDYSSQLAWDHAHTFVYTIAGSNLVKFDRLGNYVSKIAIAAGSSVLVIDSTSSYAYVQGSDVYTTVIMRVNLKTSVVSLFASSATTVGAYGPTINTFTPVAMSMSSTIGSHAGDVLAIGDERHGVLIVQTSWPCAVNQYPSATVPGACLTCAANTMADGSQSACVPITCAVVGIKLTNGASNTDGITSGTCTSSLALGSSCNLQCAPSFAISGPPITCSASGTNNNVPSFISTQVCAPITCTPTVPTFGMIGDGSSFACSNDPPTSVAFGGTCMQSCSIGYYNNDGNHNAGSCGGLTNPGTFSPIGCAQCPANTYADPPTAAVRCNSCPAFATSPAGSAGVGACVYVAPIAPYVTNPISAASLGALSMYTPSSITFSLVIPDLLYAVVASWTANYNQIVSIDTTSAATMQATPTVISTTTNSYMTSSIKQDPSNHNYLYSTYGSSIIVRTDLTSGTSIDISLPSLKSVSFLNFGFALGTPVSTSSVPSTQLYVSDDTHVYSVTFSVDVTTGAVKANTAIFVTFGAGALHGSPFAFDNNNQYMYVALNNFGGPSIYDTHIQKYDRAGASVSTYLNPYALISDIIVDGSNSFFYAPSYYSANNGLSVNNGLSAILKVDMSTLAASVLVSPSSTVGALGLAIGALQPLSVAIAPSIVGSVNAGKIFAADALAGIVEADTVWCKTNFVKSATTGVCTKCPSGQYSNYGDAACSNMMCTPVAVPTNGAADTVDRGACNPSNPIAVGSTCMQQCGSGFSSSGVNKAQCTSSSTDAAPTQIGTFTSISCTQCPANTYSTLSSGTMWCTACGVFQTSPSGSTSSDACVNMSPLVSSMSNPVTFGFLSAPDINAVAISLLIPDTIYMVHGQGLYSLDISSATSSAAAPTLISSFTDAKLQSAQVMYMATDISNAKYVYCVLRCTGGAQITRTDVTTGVTVVIPTVPTDLIIAMTSLSFGPTTLTAAIGASVATLYYSNNMGGCYALALSTNIASGAITIGRSTFINGGLTTSNAVGSTPASSASTLSSIMWTQDKTYMYAQANNAIIKFDHFGNTISSIALTYSTYYYGMQIDDSGTYLYAIAAINSVVVRITLASGVIVPLVSKATTVGINGPTVGPKAGYFGPSSIALTSKIGAHAGGRIIIGDAGHGILVANTVQCSVNQYVSATTGACAACASGTVNDGSAPYCSSIFCAPPASSIGVAVGTCSKYSSSSLMPFGASCVTTCMTNYYQTATSLTSSTCGTAAGTAVSAVGLVSTQTCAPVSCALSVTVGVANDDSSSSPSSCANIASSSLTVPIGTCTQSCAHGYAQVIASSSTSTCVLSATANAAFGVFTPLSCAPVISSVTIPAPAGISTVISCANDLSGANQYCITTDGTITQHATSDSNNLVAPTVVVSGVISSYRLPTSIGVDAHSGIWLTFGSSTLVSNSLVWYVLPTIAKPTASSVVYAVASSSVSKLNTITFDPTGTKIYMFDSSVGSILSIDITPSFTSSPSLLSPTRRRLLTSRQVLVQYATGLTSATSMVWNAAGTVLFVLLSNTNAGVKAVSGGGATVKSYGNNLQIQTGASIALDSLGNLYVVDTTAHDVVVIAPTGATSLLSSTNGAISSKPTSVSFNAKGELLVKDASGATSKLSSGASCATFAPVNGIVSDGSLTGCGATLASGDANNAPSCTQGCLAGYHLTSSPAFATCSGMALFTPQQCAPSTILSYAMSSATVATSTTAPTIVNVLLTASALPAAGASVTVNSVCTMVAANAASSSASLSLSSTSATLTSSSSSLSLNVAVTVPMVPCGTNDVVSCRLSVSGSASQLFAFSTSSTFSNSPSLTWSASTSCTSIAAQPNCSSFAIGARTALTLAANNVFIGGRVASVTLSGAATMIDSPDHALASSVSLSSCSSDIALATTSSTSLAITSACRPIGKANSGDMTGLTLTAGVYCSPLLSIAAGGTVTLDAAGNNNAVFVIKATSTSFILGASSSIRLVNGARAANVYFFVATSMTIGASSIVVGSVYAAVAATFGANVNMYGRVFAATITMGANSRVDLSQMLVGGPSSSTSSSPSVMLSTCASSSTSSCLSSFSLLSDIAITLGQTNRVAGNIGLVSGVAVTLAPTPSAKSVIIGNLASPLAESSRLYYTLTSLSCNVIDAELGGRVLTPGTYCSKTGAFTIAANSALTLSRDAVTGDTPPDASIQFVLRASGTLITGAGSSIKVVGSAVAADVFVAIGASLTVGANNNIVGTYLVGVSATVGANVNIVGRIVSTVATTLGANVAITLA